MICSAGSLAGADQAPLQEEPKLLTDIRSLETKVLGQSSPGESIEQRLDAIEMKLFGQKSSASLYDRITKIKAQTDADSSVLPPAVKPKPSEVMPPPATVEETNKGIEIRSDKTPPPASKDKANAPTESINKPPPDRKPSPFELKTEQLRKIQAVFEDSNFKLAHKLATDFVNEHPYEHNGYFALAQIDIQERSSPPEYDQYAYNQLLKAYYLQPGNKLCDKAFTYLRYAVGVTRRNDPKCIFMSSRSMRGPQALLNVGVNCFKRDDEKDAIDIFKFVAKFSPGGAASAYYNLAAIAESHGQLSNALKLYQSAEAAWQKRCTLDAARLLKFDDADRLSERLLARTLQRVNLKIKNGDKVWQGVVPDPNAPESRRLTINRLGPNDWSDTADAGVPADE